MARAEIPSDYPPPGMEVRLIKRLARLEGKRVLEIGCGDGRLTREYANLVESVVAIDPEADDIAAARRLAAAWAITNVDFRVGYAEHLTLGARQFDVTLFSWSL